MFIHNQAPLQNIHNLIIQPSNDFFNYNSSKKPKNLSLQLQAIPLIINLILQLSKTPFHFRASLSYIQSFSYLKEFSKNNA